MKVSKQTSGKIKTVVTVSLFWIVVAGLVILFQAATKNAYVHGMNDGLTNAKILLKK